MVAVPTPNRAHSARIWPLSAAFLVISSLVGAHAATLTFNTAMPSDGTVVISNTTGAAFDADNVGGSGVNASGSPNNGAANDGTTYIASDRPAQGQTFTTGSNSGGYALNSITVRMQGYTNNIASGNSIGGYNLSSASNSIYVRVGQVDGTTLIPVICDIAYTGGSGNPGSGGTANGPGIYLTFTFAVPVILKPNTVYGFDLAGGNGPYCELLGIRNGATGGNPYAGGTAYTSGASGWGNNTVTAQAGERVFRVAMTPYTATTTNSTFVHPGLLHTQDDFDRMCNRVAHGADPWTMGFNYLTSQGYAQLGANPRPLATVIRGGTGENYNQMIIDIDRANYLALRWKVTGDVRYADLAVVFLNSWASTMTTLTGNADRFLASGLYGFGWANVAEIMRTYPGWAAADISKFQTWLLNIYYPMQHDFLVQHNGAYITNYWANWDLSNITGMIAIGIFCDRQDIYNEAVDYVYNGAGNGSFGRAIYYIHPGNLGQWQESGRDQGHTIFGVGLVAEICEMAWSQGLDLYSYDNNRLLAGAEYVAKYNAGYDVPFWTYAWGTGVNGTWSSQPGVSPASRYGGGPGYELVYNHYVNRKGLAAPWMKARAEALRPEGISGDYQAFGTLTASLDPIATGATPTLTARETNGAIELDWWGSAYATGYNVYRATSTNGTYSKIGTTAANIFTYTDTSSTTTPGSYYYKVSGILSSGETALSTAAHATTLAASELVTNLTFSETSGTTAADSSGNNHTGTLVGTVTHVTGKSGNGISLDGSTGYVTLPTGVVADLGDCTIATWVKPNATQTWARIFDFGDGTGRYMYLTPRSSGGKVQFGVTTVYGYNAQFITGTAALTTGAWSHVAVALKGDRATLYVNGVAVGGCSTYGFLPFQLRATKQNYLGRSQFSADPYFNGLIDEFRIYRTALDAASIYTLATGSTAPAVPAAPAPTAIANIGNSITLTWSAISTATNYTVKRSTSASGPWSTIATYLTSTSYTDSGLTAGTTYYYQVIASNTGGDCASPTTVSAVALPPLPGAPAPVAAASSPTAIKLSWYATSDTASYTVKRATTSGGTYTTLTSGITATSYTDTSLTIGSAYYYTITAVNAAGSTASSEVNEIPNDLFVQLTCDDGSGTTAANAVEANWPATLVNAPTWTAGRLGSAVTLAKASSQYATLPSGVVSGLTDCTISTWVYLNSSTAWERVFDFGTGTGNYMFLSTNNSSAPQFSIYNGSTTDSIAGTAAIPIGAWTHLAVTIKGTTGTLYVNGVAVGTNTAMTLTPASLGITTQNYLGDSQFSADPYLDGAIDDLRIYSTALNATAIGGLAAGRTAVSDALVQIPFDEGTGTTASDVTGDGFNATLMNSPTWTTGVSSNAIVFSKASSQYATLPTGVTSNLNDCTISAWVYPVTNSMWQRVFDFGNDTTNYMFLTTNAGGKVRFAIRTPSVGEQQVTSSTTLSTGVWSHIAVTVSGSVGKLYINGVQVGTNTAMTLRPTQLGNTTNNYLGRSQFSADPYLDGRIDDFRIYDRALSLAGVEALATTTAVSKLRVHLPFDENSGTLAQDYSGNGWPATLVNAPTWTTGKSGNGIDLVSTSSQYAALPEGVVNGLTTCTISAWVYPVSVSNWQRIFDFGTGTTNYMFLTPSAGGYIRFAIRTPAINEQIINSTTVLSVGAWSHVAVVLNGTTGTLYVNGTAIGTNTAMTLTPSSLGSTTQNWIGRSQFSADPYLNGIVDDFRIYGGALTATQVAALAAGTTMNVAKARIDDGFQDLALVYRWTRR
jgi:fibronectin type 3 domain-containing protein